MSANLTMARPERRMEGWHAAPGAEDELRQARALLRRLLDAEDRPGLVFWVMDDARALLARSDQPSRASAADVRYRRLMGNSVTVNGATIELASGDITTQAVDAIANAANQSLRGGGGVDGAIHRAAGPGLLDELRRRYSGGTPTGTAVATEGHDLPSRWVLHAVGPVWRGGGHDEATLLADAYRACLRLADELGARSVAFPAISMGIYGYPPHPGARIAIRAVADHLAAHGTPELVRFVLFSEETYGRFADALAELDATTA
jgi:O-acetyl-ADP-ribose deacetylase (regulator of RNase III)